MNNSNKCLAAPADHADPEEEPLDMALADQEDTADMLDDLEEEDWGIPHGITIKY